MDFADFPKMARWSREIIVTEKLDGTNAAVVIADGLEGVLAPGAIAKVRNLDIYAQSRTKFITPADDNHGFARWVVEHAEELADRGKGLGEGRHFGEWWGSGIQRKYGLAEKRFSLFNVSRWYDTHEDGNYISEPGELVAAPSCCHVVPVLIRGPNRHDAIDITLDLLRERGSYAAPGFMDPEGIVIWHTAANMGFKKTIKRDEVPKGLDAYKQAAAS